ncbi:MAG: hypothetical protein V9H26_01565 [Verrucomicrobiota bacterium]
MAAAVTAALKRPAKAGWRGRPVLLVESVQLTGRLAGLEDQRFAVGESVPVARLDEVIQAHTGLRRQRAAKLVTFAILARETHGIKRADAQRDEIVQHRARAARLGANVRHVVHGQTRFNGSLRPGRVNFQVAIQTEIANHRDAQPGVLRRDGFETVGVHGRQDWKMRSSNGAASR